MFRSVMVSALKRFHYLLLMMLMPNRQSSLDQVSAIEKLALTFPLYPLLRLPDPLKVEL